MQRTFRAAPTAYVILVGLLTIPAVLWLFAMFRQRQFDLEALIWTLSLPIAVAAWLAAFRLVISDHRITYRSLFGGTRSVELNDVASIDVSLTTPTSGAPLGVRVKVRDGNAFVINTKPFPIEAARMLLNAAPNKPRER